MSKIILFSIFFKAILFVFSTSEYSMWDGITTLKSKNFLTIIALGSCDKKESKELRAGMFYLLWPKLNT